MFETADGRPIFIDLPRRAEIMEHAANDLFEALKRLSVNDLKALRPTGPFIRLVDALIAVRLLLGEDPTTAQQIEDIQRQYPSSTFR